MFPDSVSEIRKLCNLNKASSFRISFLVIDNCQANRSGYQLKAYGEERLKKQHFFVKSSGELILTFGGSNLNPPLFSDDPLLLVRSARAVKYVPLKYKF